MSELEKEVEEIYNNGYAIIQYNVIKDNFAARYRNETYEFNDFNKLEKMGNVVTFKNTGLNGIKSAPVKDILYISNIMEIK